MKVIFIRHGESEANVRNEINSERENIARLTELGRKQAREAGKKLKNKNIEVIFCSPFPRAVETAELINETLKKKIVVDERVREIALGFEGENIRNYQEAREKSGMSEVDFKFEGKESFREVAERVKNFLEELRERDFETVLVVTHEATLMVAPLALELGGDESVFATRFGNCGIREIELE